MEQNYLPLFRKYRPQSFKDVVGQESLTKALSNAIELNRIANAYLFCGPRGTGKTSCARIFAKSLNCVNGPTLEPCQKCASCTDITNATGLDVIEIDAASNRGIQDAKEIIAQVQYAPINGKYKIFIIDEVHMLSNDAFNALLKTFEEPPKNVIFILATTEPHKVLETIVSRCQRFDLKRITTDDIIKRLREISDLENIKITDDALFTIAKNVSGGLRDSLALLDQVSILGVREEITKDLIEEVLGKINFDTLLTLLKYICDENVEMSLVTIDEIYAKGNEPRNLAENFMEFLRNVILTLNSTDPQNITKFTSLVSVDIEKINASNFDKDKIIRILNILIEYYKEIKISTNPYLWMELAAIACAKEGLKQEQKPAIKAANTADLSAQAPIVIKTPEIKPQIGKIEKPVENEVTIAPKPQAQPQAQQTQTNTQVPPEVAKNQDGAQIWMNIISNISSLPAKAFYSGVAKLVGVEGTTIKLGFLNDNVLQGAKSPSKLPLLQSAIDSTYKGYSVDFIRIDSDTKVIEIKPKLVSSQAQKPPSSNMHPIQSPIRQEAPEQTQEKESQEENEKQLQNEKKHYSPKVQDMIEQFSGKIIE